MDLLRIEILFLSDQILMQFFVDGIKPTGKLSNDLTLPLETATRKKIDQMLNNKEWLTNELSDNYNVYTERVKTKEQTEKLQKESVIEEREFTKEFYKLSHETRLMMIKASRKRKHFQI